MTNPTSNFNWQMPTASDLVTDLPADFETFGQAVDTSLADLKGGTTGQVLSKASNTDMDFTWTTDASGISPTILDAKGDLIAASAADTPARLAVGNNGETLVADSSTSTGLRYQGNYAAGKNKIINGDFGIWQRGTTFSGNNQYTSDRWLLFTSNFAGKTVSRIASGLTGFLYATRVQRDSGVTNTNGVIFSQSLESAVSIPAAGQTVTLSFWAKKGANFSGDIYPTITSGTGTDQNVSIGGFTGANNFAQTAPTFTTSWVRYFVSGVMPSNATQLGIKFEWYPSGTAGAADFYEITGVQLEAGSVATAFQTATGTLQGELAACQRYYYRTNSGGLAYSQTPSLVMGGSGNGYFAVTTLPVKMRVAPTAIEFSNLAVWDGLVTSAISTATLLANQSSSEAAAFSGSAGATTQYRPYSIINNNNTAGYLGFSAEL